MRKFYNITSRPTYHDCNGMGIYLAVGGGVQWLVSRPQPGAQWYARPHCYREADEGRWQPVHRDTLAQISRYLGALDMESTV